MQQIFYTTATPEEYHRMGENFPFPIPDSCPNPECLAKVPPQKHSFYKRNVISTTFNGRILIRRYYCKHCGKTISYLPSFCLPYFQYTVEIIFTALCHTLNSNYSLRSCLKLLKNLEWTPSHLQFYVKRFLNNLNRIKVGLRQLIPGTRLPPPEEDKRKGAKEVLSIVTTGFPQIQTFATRFYTQCRYSFMTPSKLF